MESSEQYEFDLPSNGPLREDWYKSSTSSSSPFPLLTAKPKPEGVAPTLDRAVAISSSSNENDIFYMPSAVGPVGDQRGKLTGTAGESKRQPAGVADSSEPTMKDSADTGVDEIGQDGEATSAARGRPPDVDLTAAKSNAADAPNHQNGRCRHPPENISDPPNLNKVSPSSSSRIATIVATAATGDGGTSKAQEQFLSKVRKEGAGIEEAAQEAGSDAHDGQVGEGGDRVRLLVGRWGYAILSLGGTIYSLTQRYGSVQCTTVQ